MHIKKTHMAILVGSAVCLFLFAHYSYYPQHAGAGMTAKKTGDGSLGQAQSESADAASLSSSISGTGTAAAMRRADTAVSADSAMSAKLAVSSSPSLSVVSSDGASHDFSVLLSDTPELREKGLGDRASIDAGQAMLFVFQDNAKHFFWMKDMQFSIDMVWLNSDKKVIYIEKDVSPDTYPEAFGPSEQSQYVLEFKAGTADSIGMNLGDRVDF